MVPEEVVLEFRNRLELNVRRWVKVLREHVKKLGTEAKEPVPSVSKGDNPALYFIKHDTPASPHREHGPRAEEEAVSARELSGLDFGSGKFPSPTQENMRVREDGLVMSSHTFYHGTTYEGLRGIQGNPVLESGSFVGGDPSEAGEFPFMRDDEGIVLRVEVPGGSVYVPGRGPKESDGFELAKGVSVTDVQPIVRVQLTADKTSWEAQVLRQPRSGPGDIEKHLPGEHDQKKHGHGRAAWAEEFTYRGKSMTKGTKEKKRKKLLEEYGDDKEFRMFGKAVSLYTQGFFEDIRKVGAAMATDTLEDLEANATGFFGSNLEPEADEEDPVMAIVGGLYEVFDVNGEEMHGNITYSFAQQLAHSLANAIEHAKPTDQPLYRGVTLSKNIKLEVGDTFDIPGSASFTRDKKMGEKFARGKMPGMFPRSGFRYVITVEGVNRAVDVDVLSPWHQQEALTNGRFEVVEFIPASRHMDDHRPGAIGEITLKQQSVVDADYTGKVRYDLPKDVGKDLSPDERSRTTSTMSMLDSLLGSEHERYVPLSRWEDRQDDSSSKKVAVALRKLGYWVGVDAEYDKKRVVVRTKKYKKTPPVKGEPWDPSEETFGEWEKRERS